MPPNQLCHSLSPTSPHRLNLLRARIQTPQHLPPPLPKLCLQHHTNFLFRHLSLQNLPSRIFLLLKLDLLRIEQVLR
jgi:hypothetical protein